MKKTLLAVLLGSFALASFAQPITIEKQGAFSAGGTVIEAKKTFDPYHPEPDAMTLHGDHANIIYQIPAHAKNVSLMFLTRCRPVHANLADNTGRKRRLPEPFPA